MSAGVSKAILRRKVRQLEKKHGRPYTYIQGSNGDMCVLPACRTCGKASPQWAPCSHERTADNAS